MPKDSANYLSVHEAGAQMLDEMNRFLDQKGITPMLLVAWRHARGLKDDASENLKEMRETEPDITWTMRQELESHHDAELEDARDFVNNYYSDVSDCLLLIEMEEAKRA